MFPNEVSYSLQNKITTNKVNLRSMSVVSNPINPYIQYLCYISVLELTVKTFSFICCYRLCIPLINAMRIVSKKKKSGKNGNHLDPALQSVSY